MQEYNKYLFANNLDELYGGGLFSKDYNEIYTLFNKMRDNKKFDYVCSDKENDPTFLNLDCIQGKLLKYILQVNLKMKKEQQKNFIINNELNVSELSSYLDTVKNNFDNFITDIEKTIEEKGGKVQKGGRVGDDPMENPIYALFVIIGYIILFIIAILATPFVAAFSKSGEKTTNLKKLWGLKGGNNKLQNMSLKQLQTMYTIIDFIKVTIDSIKKTIPAKNIPIINICVNGTSVNGKKKHIKCKKNDYKAQSKVDMTIVKTIFKKMDLKLDQTSEISVDNLEKEINQPAPVADAKKIEEEIKKLEKEPSDDDESAS
jgi:hypothetical protein